MFTDETWKCEIGKKDQIIAFSTKNAELQAKLENQVKQLVSLATQAKKEITPDSANEGSTSCSKRDPYTVTAWQLTKKEGTERLFLVHRKSLEWRH
jgi:hypothetical protein